MLQCLRWSKPSFYNPVTSISRAYALARLTRKEKIEGLNHIARSKLYQLDTRFDLFNEKVSNVVDLGYAPGNWLSYARDALLVAHNIDPERIYQKCTLVGLDIVIGNHPLGSFTTQGNIFSKLAHKNVTKLLKEHAYRRLAVQNGILQHTGNKGNGEFTLDSEMAKISEMFLNLDINDEALESIMSIQDYQANLVLSDMSNPFLQDKGFFNNTTSRPYIRSSTNPALRHHTSDPLKSSIDTADAALLLCCDVLAKGGTFLIRLSRVDLADPELLLLEQRLKKTFLEVNKWNPEGVTESEKLIILELYFVCKHKTEHIADKYEVFDVIR